MKRIDNVDFAKKQQTLSGNIESSTLMRAQEIYEELSGKLEYTINGNIDDKNKPVLTVIIYGKITTLCQNCLEKLVMPINYNNTMPIFYTEPDMDNALFGMQVQYTDGIMADANFDILNFIEDELIMLLPIAPRHKLCKAIGYQDKSANPFSVLVK